MTPTRLTGMLLAAARRTTTAKPPLRHAFCTNRNNGLWREGFPDAQTMNNGIWRAKGSVWAWARICGSIAHHARHHHNHHHHHHHGFCARFKAAADAACAQGMREQHREAWRNEWMKRRLESHQGWHERWHERHRQWHEKWAEQHQRWHEQHRQWHEEHRRRWHTRGHGHWHGYWHRRHAPPFGNWTTWGSGSGFSWDAFERVFWAGMGGWRARWSRRRAYCRSFLHRRHARHDHNHRAARSRLKTALFYWTTTRTPDTPPHLKPGVLFTKPIHMTPAIDSHVESYSSDVPPPQPRTRIHSQVFNATRTFALRTPLLNFTLDSRAPVTSISARLFSSRRMFATLSSIREPLQAAVPVLVPVLAVLKSSAILNVVGVVTRVALTLLPIGLRAKIISAMRQRYHRDPSSASQWLQHVIKREGPTNSTATVIIVRYILPFLVTAPLILFGVAIVASLERTPVSGRTRIVMLSPDEETELVASVLSVGDVSGQDTRDWVTILRHVLDLRDEGVNPVTGRRILLGGEVLDERDWRVRWTDAVLRALENGIPALAASSESKPSITNGVLSPPPTNYPLHLRPGHLEHNEEDEIRTQYDLLVIDRKEPNAFSFGFGPDEMKLSPGRRGVIVVYSGFIDEILGSPPSRPAPVPTVSLETARPSPGIATFFSNLFSSSSTRRPAPSGEDPSMSNFIPDTLPTPAQTKSLAVLLSHELSHLVLSHTLESYASTSLLIPQLSKLVGDVARTFLYPITAIFGPFLNDAIGRSMNEGASGGFGVLGNVVSSCESRTLEGEADLVALRLLAYSGVDPRFAVDFWEDRLVHPSSNDPATSTSEVAQNEATTNSHLLRLHSANHNHKHDSACGFLRTHPVDEERIQRIKSEIEKWIAFNTLPKAT